MLPSSPASAFYSIFLERLMNVAFRVHLRQDEYLRYAFIASLPLRRLPEILARPTEWFDRDSATAVRLRDKAIAQAFHEAIEHGRTRIDPELQKWRWGQVHQLVLAHPMASVAAYRPLLERRLNSIGGDATTVANGLWRIPKPFDLSVGASLRFVARLRDTVVYTILPGGVSGNPLSSNFADQLTLWANGGLLAVPIAPVPPPSWTKATVLLPQQ
jgi:penicillin amidase